MKRLIKHGFDVKIESGAGLASHFTDMSYSEANAQIVDRNEIWKSDIICKIQPPTTEELNLLENRVLISLLKPHNNHQLFESIYTRIDTHCS